MRLYAILGIAAGIFSLSLGVLFTLYIQITPANLASDLIFLAAGFLLLRKGWNERNAPSKKNKTTRKEEIEGIKKDPKTNQNSKQKYKYRNRKN